MRSVSITQVSDVKLLPGANFTYSITQTPLLTGFPMAIPSKGIIRMYGQLVRGVTVERCCLRSVLCVLRDCFVRFVCPCTTPR